jgi:hypothetical protein
MEKGTISLKEIDRVEILTKYGLIKEQEFDNKSIRLEHDTTTIVAKQKQTKTVNFLDETKRTVKCHVSSSDLSTERDNMLLYDCFWCRHKVENQPIGCPLRYIPQQAIKRYTSNISNDIYTIKENITTKRSEFLKETQEIRIQQGEYYETDGYFCSFNCVLAWIEDNKHDDRYNQSKMLLYKIFKMVNKGKITKLNPAPHWRMLTVYGGSLTISEFRENFDKIEYKEQGIITPKPNFLPIGTLFEERYKF